MALPPRKGLMMARPLPPTHSEPDAGDMDMPDMEMGYDQGGEGDDGHDQAFQQWQAAVEQDRQRHKDLTGKDYDAWDMHWREQAKRAGLDEQEVDAYMDSLWEAQGSEPQQRTPEWEGGGSGDYRRSGRRP